MRILVDMDDCICDWTAKFDEEVAPYRSFGILPSAESPGFDKFAGLSDEATKIVLEIFNKPGYYRHLKPISGAIQALTEMENEGHDVHLLTAPWQGNPTCASDKYAWVNEHLGLSWTYKTILSNNKGLVHGDILIDDRPSVRGSEQASWTQVYYTRGHNKGLPGPRLDDWKNWRSVLLLVETSSARHTT